MFFYLHRSYCTHSFWIWSQSSYPYFLTLKLEFSCKVWVALKVWQHSCTVSPSDVAQCFQYSDEFRPPQNLDFYRTTAFFSLPSHVHIQQLIYSRKCKLPVLRFIFISTICETHQYIQAASDSHRHNASSCCHVYKLSSCVNKLHT